MGGNFFEKLEAYPTDMVRNYGFFKAQHSAHAEPMAAELTLAIGQVVREGIPNGSRIALITRHGAIVHAQRPEMVLEGSDGGTV